MCKTPRDLGAFGIDSRIDIALTPTGGGRNTLAAMAIAAAAGPINMLVRVGNDIGGLLMTHKQHAPRVEWPEVTPHTPPPTAKFIGGSHHARAHKS